MKYIYKLIVFITIISSNLHASYSVTCIEAWATNCIAIKTATHWNIVNNQQDANYYLGLLYNNEKNTPRSTTAMCPDLANVPATTWQKAVYGIPFTASYRNYPNALYVAYFDEHLNTLGLSANFTGDQSLINSKGQILLTASGTAPGWRNVNYNTTVNGSSRWNVMCFNAGNPNTISTFTEQQIDEVIKKAWKHFPLNTQETNTVNQRKAETNKFGTPLGQAAKDALDRISWIITMKSIHNLQDFYDPQSTDNWFLDKDLLNTVATFFQNGTLPHPNLNPMSINKWSDDQKNYTQQHLATALSTLNNAMNYNLDKIGRKTSINFNPATFNGIVITEIYNNTKSNFTIFQGTGQTITKIGSLKPGLNNVALYGAANSQGDIVFVSDKSNMGTFRVTFMKGSDIAALTQTESSGFTYSTSGPSSNDNFLCVQIKKGQAPQGDFPQGVADEMQNMISRTHSVNLAQLTQPAVVSLRIEDNMTIVQGNKEIKIDQTKIPMFYASIREVRPLNNFSVLPLLLPDTLKNQQQLNSWIDFLNFVIGAIATSYNWTYYPSVVQNNIQASKSFFVLRQQDEKYGSVNPDTSDQLQDPKTYDLSYTAKSAGYIIGGLPNTEYLFTSDIPDKENLQTQLSKLKLTLQGIEFGDKSSSLNTQKQPQNAYWWGGFMIMNQHLKNLNDGEYLIFKYENDGISLVDMHGNKLYPISPKLINLAQPGNWNIKKILKIADSPFTMFYQKFQENAFNSISFSHIDAIKLQRSGSTITASLTSNIPQPKKITTQIQPSKKASTTQIKQDNTTFTSNDTQNTVTHTTNTNASSTNSDQAQTKTQTPTTTQQQQTINAVNQENIKLKKENERLKKEVAQLQADLSA